MLKINSIFCCCLLLLTTTIVCESICFVSILINCDVYGDDLVAISVLCGVLFTILIRASMSKPTVFMKKYVLAHYGVGL